MGTGADQVKGWDDWQWFGLWFFLEFRLGLEGGHVPDLLDLPIQVVYNFLHVFELKGEFGPLLSRVGELLDQICVFLGGPLDLLVSPFDSEVSLLVDFLNFRIDVSDMSFYLIHAASVVIVAFVLRHKLKIFVVDGVHLLLVILAVAAFGLGHRLYLLADAAQFYSAVLGEVLLGLQLLLQ